MERRALPRRDRHLEPLKPHPGTVRRCSELGPMTGSTSRVIPKRSWPRRGRRSPAPPRGFARGVRGHWCRRRARDTPRPVPGFRERVRPSASPDASSSCSLPHRRSRPGDREREEIYQKVRGCADGPRRPLVDVFVRKLRQKTSGRTPRTGPTSTPTSASATASIRRRSAGRAPRRPSARPQITPPGSKRANQAPKQPSVHNASLKLQLNVTPWVSIPRRFASMEVGERPQEWAIEQHSHP